MADRNTAVNIARRLYPSVVKMAGIPDFCQKKFRYFPALLCFFWYLGISFGIFTVSLGFFPDFFFVFKLYLGTVPLFFRFFFRNFYVSRISFEAPLYVPWYVLGNLRGFEQVTHFDNEQMICR